MALAFQEVDPDDLSTVLWDYNDPTGTNNIGSVKTRVGLKGAFNIGAPAVSIDTSDRTGDGVPDLAFSYDTLVQSTFSMWMQFSSYDVGRTAIGTLQRLLAVDGVIRYVPDGSANTYYIYRKPSSIPALLSGKENELLNVMSQLITPAGIDIVINRERHLRGPVLLASVNALTNATLLIGSTASSTAMNNWGWDSTTNITTSGYGANVNWPNQSYRFTIATTGTRNFRQTTAASTAAPADVWTFSFYTKASGGSLAKAQAVLEFLKADDTILATATGTLTTLSSTEQRLSVTSSAAPALTDHMRAHLRYANADATTYTVDHRRAQLEKASSASTFRVGAETASMLTVDGFGKTVPVYNPGDANAIARMTLTPSAGANTVAYLMARKSEGLDVDLTETINQMTSSATSFRTKTLAINATMYGGTSGDTSSVADSGTTGGANAAKTTFTNQSSLVRRWRWVITPTDVEALHGNWNVYAAVRGETGSAYRVCMHWQAATRDPVANVEDEITFDCTNINSSRYVPLYLGDVSFDANAGDTTLVIEGWAARDDANANSLWWDVVYLVPADEQQALIEVPGFRRGQQSREVWLGSELTSRVAGAVAGASTPAGSTKVVMDTLYEGVGTPPSSVTTGGLIWAAGWHSVTASVDLQIPSNPAAVGIGYVRIRKAPGVGATVGTWTATTTYAVGDFVKPTFANLNTRTYVTTAIGSAPHHSGGAEPTWTNTDAAVVTSGDITFTETTVSHKVLKTKATFTTTRTSAQCGITADGSTAYEGIVVATDDIEAWDASIHLTRLVHTTLRVIDSGYSAKMLGDLEQIGTYNGTTSIDDLVKAGPYITLGPGLNVLWVDLWSLPPTGYDDIDPRDALAYHDPTQSTTVSVDVIPRYWS